MSTIRRDELPADILAALDELEREDRRDRSALRRLLRQGTAEGRRRDRHNLQMPAAPETMPRSRKTPAWVPPWVKSGYGEPSKAAPSATPMHHDDERPELADEQPHIDGLTNVDGDVLTTAVWALAVEFSRGEAAVREAIEPLVRSAMERGLDFTAALMEARATYRDRMARGEA